ncbi:hypothetical protein [Streptomyces sp. NPDC094468]|uniref:hypothetical protein n=1 Tax=Streptomyces sp. NPDC094468 TaxID=3366066 RepID=UPI0037F82CDC
MLRLLRHVLRPVRLRIPARRFAEGISALPPTSREALGMDATAGEAVAYNRSRVAVGTAVTLYRSGYRLPLPNEHLEDAVRALGFPYSVPSRETLAAIRAALAVLEADPSISTTV